MKNNLKKLLVLLLAANMFAGTTLPTFAEEGNTIDGLTPTITTGPITTEETDEDTGDTTITVTFTETIGGGLNENGKPNGFEITSEGKELNYEQTTTTTTTTNKDGEVIGSSTVVDGSEIKKWDEEVKPGQDVPSVEVTLKPGEKKDVTVTEETDNIEGGSTETNSDKTTTTTTTDRTVNVEISKEKTEATITTDLECPVGPEDYEGKEYLKTSAGIKGVCGCKDDHCVHDREGVFKPDPGQLDDLGYVDGKPTEEGFEGGYDMVWTGSGEGTDAAAAVLVKYGYELNEDGSVKTDENGDPIRVIEYYSEGYYKHHENGMVYQSSQFALQDPNNPGEYFYAYCMDASTGATPEINKWYRVYNIENAIKSEENPDGYLTEEDAEHIKLIATYGYWGTDANVYELDAEGNVILVEDTDENGNPKLDENGNPIYKKLVAKDAEGNIVTDSSVRGSVASLVEMVKNYYEGKDTTITVTYPDGTTNSKNILEVIEDLTESEALAVTQAAIWTYSNNDDVDYVLPNGTFVEGGLSVAGVLSALKLHNGSDDKNTGLPASFVREYLPQKDIESDVRLQALYEILLGLADLSEEELANIAGHIELPAKSESTVIPNENLVTSVGLVIKDKDADHEANKDPDTTNDVYNTDLSFTLAFVPDPDTDDLLVYISYTNADGGTDTIVRRLAGEGSEGENIDKISADENGVYTLEGLQLREGDTAFNLELKGTQYLQEGVYIYQAKGGREESQTLVGLATGTLDVDVKASMTINFNVDETNHVVAERKWHYEEDPEIEEEDPTPDPDPKDPKPDPKDEDPKDEDPKDEDPKDEEPKDEDPKDEDPKDEDPKPEETTKRKFSFKLKVEEEPEIVEIPEEEIPLVNIPDEEIPLTDIPDEPVPMTGDSMFWYISSAAAVLGLCVLNLLGKKKNHNA